MGEDVMGTACAIMDDTPEIDLTDWETLLEVLDGARAPYAALPDLTTRWAAVLERRNAASALPAVAETPAAGPVNWRLEP
jgi:hypothetical protein